MMVDVVISEMQAEEITYRAMHNGENLPPDILWGMTNAVVINREDRVFVGHTFRAESPCKDTVVIFNRAGDLVTSWGAQFEGHMHGLTLHELGSGRTTHLDDWGKSMAEVFKLRELPTDQLPVGSFCSAQGAAVFSTGALRVSEGVEHGRFTTLTPAQGN